MNGGQQSRFDRRHKDKIKIRLISTMLGKTGSDMGGLSFAKDREDERDSMVDI